MPEWFLTIDPGVRVPYAEAFSEIQAALARPGGWRASFRALPPAEGARRKYTERRSGVFHLRIAPERTVRAECGFEGLSCAVPAEGRVLFNERRWLGGSAASGLQLAEYRTYLVLHEVGHLLGLEHVRPGAPGTPCPVMFQQTISDGSCAPNTRPLPREISAQKGRAPAPPQTRPPSSSST